MRKAVLLLTVTIFFVTTGSAQLMELTADQMLKSNTTGLINDMPKVGGWADDTHYILYRPLGNKKYDTVLIDVKSGKEIAYTVPAENKASVSIKANDIVYKAADGTEKQLTNNKDEEKNPTLAPDGTKVAFTRNNDLYVVDVATGREDRLTADGSDLVYNGWASWVYYEEILGRPTKYKAFWWSPDSKRIAYMHFNDTEVPPFPIVGADGQHGYVENTRYPKAGDKNPEVKVGIADIYTRQTVWSDFNEKDDQYFGTPFWTPDGSSLWLQWMNRHQNHLVVYAIDPATGSKKNRVRRRSKDLGRLAG